MKKILDIIPCLDNDGNRVIKIKYKNGYKIIPFSESELLKYKKKYESQNDIIIKSVEIKTNTKNVDVNMDRFADYIINNKDVIVRRIKFILTIGALLYGIKSCHSEFSNLPDVVLPDEEKEEVVTYDVSEYYYNLNNNETKTK